jgi:AAA family ATPase
MVSICQDAGLRAMNENINAIAITQAHLEAAAHSVRRRITSAMIHKYEAWRDHVAVG